MTAHAYALYRCEVTGRYYLVRGYYDDVYPKEVACKFNDKKPHKDEFIEISSVVGES